jgi:thioredoxin
MSKIAELTEENFDQAIAEGTTPAVVDVYAPWCGPCKMLAPLMEQLADHFAGRIPFFKVNVDEAPGLAGRFDITGVPTLLLFSDGKLRDTVVGLASPRALLTKLEALAANAAEAHV